MIETLSLDANKPFERSRFLNRGLTSQRLINDSFEIIVLLFPRLLRWWSKILTTIDFVHCLTLELTQLYNFSLLLWYHKTTLVLFRVYFNIVPCSFFSVHIWRACTGLWFNSLTFSLPWPWQISLLSLFISKRCLDYDGLFRRPVRWLYCFIFNIWKTIHRAFSQLLVTKWFVLWLWRVIKRSRFHFLILIYSQSTLQRDAVKTTDCWKLSLFFVNVAILCRLEER